MIEKLRKLQLSLNETLTAGLNSYAYSITRPKLFKQLTLTIQAARDAGTADDDIDMLVSELEVETGRRPIELETLWDPRRLSKTYRRRSD